MKKKWLALFCAAACVAGLLTGCGPKEAPTPTPDPTPTAEVTPTPDTGDKGEKETLRVAMISGPTGMGAAKLMADSEQGTTALDYTFTVYTDNNEVVNALAQGEVDVAALATNVAANFYRKTNGGIQLAAINTYGVLKLMQGGEGEDVTSLEELAGETIYAVGQGANPEFVLNYLLTEHGLDPQTDVDIRWMTAEEVTQGLISGKTRFAMLPVPAATAAQIKGEGVRQVLDLSEVWDEVNTSSRLTMGCVVVRTAYAQEQPEVVRTFLEEYEASIAYMTDPANLALSSEANPAELVDGYGIAPSSAIDGKALGQAKLTFLSGAKDLRNAIQGYYEVLYEANPASIGGGIPDDGFYFE